jgi:hypothetical protein
MPYLCCAEPFLGQTLLLQPPQDGRRGTCAGKQGVKLRCAAHLLLLLLLCVRLGVAGVAGINVTSSSRPR